MRSNFPAICSMLTLSLCSFSLGAQNISQNMTLLGQWTVDSLPVHSGIKFNDVWGYADCDGREYAILGSAGRIHFIDVTLPENPVEIASFPGTVNSIWRDFKTFRDRAYACADQGTDGLMVFDLSQLPDTVTMTYQDNSIFRRSHNLWVDTLQGRLYMAGANTQSNGVIIYDLNANPDSPTLLASIPLPGGYIHDIHVVNHIGYCSHGGNGLWVYDFTNPQSPALLGSMTDYPERGYNHSSWLDASGDYLIMADETHGTSLKVVDVQDLDEIQVRSLFKSALLAPELTGSIVHNPFIRDQYVVISYYHEGIQIYDMTNPDSVVRVAYYDTYPINTNYNGFEGAWGAYPYLPSGNILGADISFGLHILRADSIQFLPGPRHRFPENAAIDPDIPAFCEGSSTDITASAGAQSYRWWRNGELLQEEGASLGISAGGYYQVEAINGHCSLRSDSVWVETLPLPLVEYGLENTILCQGDSVWLELAGNADSLFLIRPDGSTERLNLSTTLTEAGQYGLEGYLGACRLAVDSAFMLEVLLPATPIIEVDGMTLSVQNRDDFQFFQWYLNGLAIDGANQPEFTALVNGTYTLEALDANTCYAFSAPVVISVSAIAESQKIAVALFPNPVSRGKAIVLRSSGTLAETGAIFHLYDTFGKRQFSWPLRGNNGMLDEEIPLSQLAPGMYYYEIRFENSATGATGKLVIVP